MATPIEEGYIKARTVLLDALEALEHLRHAVILVGAQAVYVHTHVVDADFSVSPFTFDADLALDPALLGSKSEITEATRDAEADLAIDPALLGNQPIITEAMQAAGFGLTDQPGIYRKADGSQVDLLVPESVGGPGRRGARLGIHGNRAAMKVHGLEGTLVSHKLSTIESLSSDDPRSCVIKVGGPAALLISKVHKIAERADDATRNLTLDKDAFDVYRLLRGVGAPELTAEIQRLLEHEISGPVTAQALSIFHDLFGNAMAGGTKMVVRHVAGVEDSDFMTASSVSLSRELLELIPQSTS